MKVLINTLILVLLVSSVLLAGDDVVPIHPVNTFSIIAYDSATGQFGAAVQSHWFKVADVIWLEPGVGAVATQSLVNFSYGPLGLEMLKNGKTPKEALDGLLTSDPNNSVRQVAIIDTSGVAAVYTGDKCIAEAGHKTGKFYSVQANLMRNNTVWGAMADAFVNTDGDLAEKLMSALEAAQAEGGDIRGKQSAALVVVSGEPTGRSWEDRLIDIRVDDSPEPLKELRRLLNISRAYDHMNMGDEYIASGEMDKAKAEYQKASELAPGNPEIMYWYAVTLVSANEVEAALPVFKEVFEVDKSWQVLIPRLVDAELFPDDEAIIKKVMDL